MKYTEDNKIRYSDDSEGRLQYVIDTCGEALGGSTPIKSSAYDQDDCEDIYELPGWQNNPSVSFNTEAFIDIEVAGDMWDVYEDMNSYSDVFNIYMRVNSRTGEVVYELVVSGLFNPNDEIDEYEYNE
jgi:hypothetical protein